MSEQGTPPGWYYADGDPAGTTRYWDGSQWVGEAQATGSGDFGSQPGVGFPPGGTGGPQLAGAWPRIGGRVLDGIIWAIMIIVVSLAVAGGEIADVISQGIEAAEEGRELTEDELEITGPSDAVSAVAGLIGSLLVVAYEVVMVATAGGTLGKMAIGAKVVKADGSPAGWDGALRRMLLYIGYSVLSVLLALGSISLANWLFLLTAIAGLVMLFANKSRQTPWDLVGGTIVVKK